MRKLYLLVIVSILSFLQLKANPLDIKEIKLSNGLTVWLNEDHTQPVITGCVVVKAGAKDSPNTGIPHYFEHIMFKGTDKIGTTDYQAEKVLLDKIADKYNRLSITKNEKERLNIQKEINRLSIEAAKYAIPNEFNNLISQYGGTKLNAATSWDYTIYFNTFSPQYIHQWCDLNSERLLNPVFRLFQSELETVYEEKNMYVDAMGSMAMEKTLERFFKPHPYQYPIIGSTENLKNPNLSEMNNFFRKYYVAGNMGLILSGDFDTEKIIPIVEKYFNRIKPGTVKRAKLEQPKPFNGREQFKAKLPIPLIRAVAMLWRGVPVNHPDENKLKLAMSLFSNENKNGLLDQLTIEGKLMQGAGMSLSMQDAGVLALLAVPNIPFQLTYLARKKLTNAVETVKRGEFSDEMFQNLKMEHKRNNLKELENIDSRVRKMIDVFSSGSQWDNYLKQVEAIDSITKEDVVEVANRYFTDNYLEVRKKTGNYPNQKISKPPFAPIVPPNKNAQSEYAKHLAELDTFKTNPRFIDFAKDAYQLKLTENGLANFYYVANPLNDVFTYEIIYEVGTHQMPSADYLVGYLNYVGTAEYKVSKFNETLQSLGATMNFAVNEKQFVVSVSGLDKNLEKTVGLVSEFLNNVVPDEKKFKKIVKEKKIADKAIRKSSEKLADASFEKVKYGKESKFLTDLSLDELKKYSGKKLIDDFQTIQSYECNVHYCGTTDIIQVDYLTKKYLPLDKIKLETKNPIYTEAKNYEKSEIYFYQDKKSTQSIIYGFVPMNIGDKFEDRNLTKLFNIYFGGGMSSVLFQEIREFRSLAYRAYSWLSLPPLSRKNAQSVLNVMLSTQADKTADALTLLDSLVNNVPFNESRFINAKKVMMNNAQNAFPNFRDISKRIVSYKQQNFDEDPNEKLILETMDVTLDQLKANYDKNIKQKKMVYVIVGNKEKIDFNSLNKIGKVTYLTEDDILK